MSRQVSEVYVALILDYSGRDQEAAMIRVNRSFRELLHVDREVSEDLVEVVAVLVRRCALRDDSCEAPGDMLPLHAWTVLVEVAGYQELAVWQIS